MPLPPLSQLCRQLGHQYKDLLLLDRALTHRSASGHNNERMEFLGDSIINFLMSHALFQRFPKANEGELTRLRTQLVRAETLAAVAQELKLSQFLRLGAGEIKTGGAQRSSICADALEAVIASIYLDGGMQACEKAVLPWFEARLERLSAENFSEKDYKTQLQEYLQKKQWALPIYEIMHTTGDAHQRLFCVTCTLPDCEYTVEGHGSSRRYAEHNAAELALQWLIGQGKKNG